MQCEICDILVTKNKNANRIRILCNCKIVCDSCFLEKYVIYNFSPIKKVRYCEICKGRLSRRKVRWLWKFTKLYFEDEGPYPNFYV